MYWMSEYNPWNLGWDLMGPHTHGEDCCNPNVDLVERDDGYDLIADLPGVDKDAVKVALKGTRLTLEGERPCTTTGGGTMCRDERWCGKFSRTITFSEDVEGSKITAEMKNGTLRVHVPKNDRGKTSVIPVKEK